jgi:hypothetical protein
VAHEAGGELQGDVALSTPLYCNRFYLVLQNFTHVATLVFYVPSVDFSCCNLHVSIFSSWYRCCNSYFSCFNCYFFMLRHMRHNVSPVRCCNVFLTGSCCVWIFFQQLAPRMDIYALATSFFLHSRNRDFGEKMSSTAYLNGHPNINIQYDHLNVHPKCLFRIFTSQI